ncbi:MAG: hypothetical protein K0Q93_826 [Nocardioidaceae bacterium]|nr:hypothetical protein [Nocardioidaceae bacterium]
MEAMTFAAGFALLAALASAIGSVAQHGAASQVPRAETSGPALMVTLARQRVWWAGVLGDAGSFAFQAVALALGPLLLVQPLLVVALVFALPVGARWSGRRVVPADVGWAVALCAGLTVFLVLGNPTAGVDHASAREWSVVGSVLGLVIGVCAFAAGMTGGAIRAGLLAVATGTCFGLSAALTKSVADLFSDSPVAVMTFAGTYALLGTGALGFYFQTAAFQAGALSASLPTMTLLEPVVAVGVGIAILQEHVRADGLEWFLLGVSGVVMVVATVALSLSSARANVP